MVIKLVEFLIGRREQISIGEETDYGTAVSPVFVLGRDATFGPRDAQNWVEIRSAGSDSINVDERELGPKTAGGTLSFAPQDWRWLKFVLCDGSSDVSDSDQTTYYQHTFTNAVDIASFTLERAMQHTTDHVLTYEGCQANSASISFDSGAGAGGALIKVTMDVIAEDVNPGTSVTSLSTPTTAAFQFRNVKLTLNNSEITELKGGTITIENNLNDARYANYTLNRFKGESAPQLRRFSGTFRINIKDDTYFDLWDTEDAISNCSIVFQRGTNDKATLTFTDFKMESTPDPTNLDGINEVTINWVAEDITVVTQDQISAY